MTNNTLFSSVSSDQAFQAVLVLHRKAGLKGYIFNHILFILVSISPHPNHSTVISLVIQQSGLTCAQCPGH